MTMTRQQLDSAIRGAKFSRGEERVMLEIMGILYGEEGGADSYPAGILATELTLTEAQLLTLHTTPVTLLAAPGADMVIVPNHVLSVLTGADVNYVVFLYYGSPAGVRLAEVTTIPDTVNINGMEQGLVSPDIAIASCVNLPIVVGTTSELEVYPGAVLKVQLLYSLLNTGS